MRPLKSDLSIYKKFDFKYPPVAVKFLEREKANIDALANMAENP
jgi:hypothetical protein